MPPLRWKTSSNPFCFSMLVAFSHRIPPVQNIATFGVVFGSKFESTHFGNSRKFFVLGSTAPWNVPIAVLELKKTSQLNLKGVYFFLCRFYVYLSSKYFDGKIFLKIIFNFYNYFHIPREKKTCLQKNKWHLQTFQIINFGKKTNGINLQGCYGLVVHFHFLYLLK